MFCSGVASFYDAVPVRPNRRRLMSKQTVLGDDVAISDLQPESDDEPLSSLLADTPSSIFSHVGSEVVAELKALKSEIPDSAKRALFGRGDGMGESDSDPDSNDFEQESMAVAKAAESIWTGGVNQDGQTGLIHIR
jgi:hypothetical protein